MLKIFPPWKSYVTVNHVRVLSTNEEPDGEHDGEVYDADGNCVAELVYEVPPLATRERVFNLKESGVVFDYEEQEIGQMLRGSVCTPDGTVIAEATGTLAVEVGAIYLALQRVPVDFRDKVLLLVPMPPQVQEIVEEDRKQPPAPPSQPTPRIVIIPKDREERGCFDNLMSAGIFAVLALVALALVVNSIFIWGGMIVVFTLALDVLARAGAHDQFIDADDVRLSWDIKRDSATNWAISYGCMYATWIVTQGPEKQWTYFKVGEWTLYVLFGVGIGLFALKKTSRWSTRVVRARLAKHPPTRSHRTWFESFLTDYSGHVVTAAVVIFVGTILYLFWLASASRLRTTATDQRQSIQSPVLQQPNTGPDDARTTRPFPDFSAVAPVASGNYNAKDKLKTVQFKQLVSARYVAWESLSEQYGAQFSSAAELFFIDEAGKQISRADAHIIFFDSEETKAEKGYAKNVLDGDPNTIWHTAYSGEVAPQPHVLVIDLGRTFLLKGFQYLPRQNGSNGHVKGYRFYAQEKPFKLP